MKKRGKSAVRRDFIWYSLRISFGIMLLLLGLSFFVNIILLNLIFLILLIFTIVISIVSLFRRKEKAFAIVTLVVSVLILLSYIIGIAIV